MQLHMGILYQYTALHIGQCAKYAALHIGNYQYAIHQYAIHQYAIHQYAMGKMDKNLHESSHLEMLPWHTCFLLFVSRLPTNWKLTC